MMRHDRDLAALQNEYDRLRAENPQMGPAIVEYTSRRATGGVIQYANWKHSYHIIRISMHMSADQQMQTLWHEAAHAFCGYHHGHDAYFWQIAYSFGCTRRFAPTTEEVLRKKEERRQRIYLCPVCDKRFTFGRLLKDSHARYHTPCASKRIPLKLVA